MYSEIKASPIIVKPNGFVGKIKCRYTCTRILSANRTVSIPALTTIDLSFEPVRSDDNSNEPTSCSKIEDVETKPTNRMVRTAPISQNNPQRNCDLLQILDKSSTNLTNPYQLLSGNTVIGNSELISLKESKLEDSLKPNNVYLNCLNFNFNCSNKFDGRMIDESNLILSGRPFATTLNSSTKHRSTKTKLQNVHALLALQKSLSFIPNTRNTRSKSAFALQVRPRPTSKIVCEDSTNKINGLSKTEPKNFNINIAFDKITEGTVESTKPKVASASANVREKIPHNHFPYVHVSPTLTSPLTEGSPISYCGVGSSSYHLIDKHYLTETGLNDNRRPTFCYSRSMYKQFQYNDYQNSKFNKIIHPNRCVSSICLFTNYVKTNNQLRRLNIC